MTEYRELVIKIPNNLYANLKKIESGSLASERILDCVKDGIPLPKGHGRIGYLDNILIWLIYRGIIDKLKCGEIADVFERSTIIEKDEET